MGMMKNNQDFKKVGKLAITSKLAIGTISFAIKANNIIAKKADEIKRMLIKTLSPNRQKRDNYRKFDGSAMFTFINVGFVLIRFRNPTMFALLLNFILPHGHHPP